MKDPRLFLWFLICGFSVTTEAYRILGIFPMCSRSHQMMFDALSKGLAKRGHQVDIVTCFPPKKKPENLTVLINVAERQTSFVNNWTFDTVRQFDSIEFLVGPAGNDLCLLMGHEEFQRIIKNPPKDPPYDLIIVEAFGENCFIGLGALFKVPVIFISTTMEMPWINRALGNPSNLAFFPSFFIELRHPMSFWQRVRNTLQDAIQTYRFYSMTGDIQTELMRKYLGPDIPHIRQLENKITLTLVNSFYTLTGVRPTTIGLIEVGGLHLEDSNTEISKGLKEWLDESKDGVVYVTFGSMVNIETMPEDFIKGLYAAFKKIAPIRVLMKVANKDKLLPGQPKNLITSSWIPQVPVLAHNNTRLFITHGGIMSTQEALNYGVPLICVPLFGDQHLNVKYFEDIKMAVILDFDNINEGTMTAALTKVLNDPSYKNAAKLQSALFRDRPMSAMETAIYWVEYTIRHGPEVLRSPAADLTWWQNDRLDVYGFLFISSILALYIVILVVKVLINTILHMIWSTDDSVGLANKKKRN